MKEKRKLTTKFLTGHILLSATILLHIAVLLLSTRVSFFPGLDVLHTIVTKEMCALAQKVSEALEQIQGN